MDRLDGRDETPVEPTLPRLVGVQVGWRGTRFNDDAVLVVSLVLRGDDGEDRVLPFTCSPEDGRRTAREILATAKLADVGERLWTPKGSG